MASYVKNGHLGFQIHYIWNGSRRRFVPDFLIRLTKGKTLVLDINGVDDDQSRRKRAALSAWVEGGNQKGGFGLWTHAVAFAPSQILDLVVEAAT